MEIKTPKTIDILGICWKVKLVPNMGANNHEYGTATYYNHTIELDAGMTNDQQTAALVHEFLHAFCDAIALEVEEKHIRALANGVQHLLSQLKIKE